MTAAAAAAAMLQVVAVVRSGRGAAAVSKWYLLLNQGCPYAADLRWWLICNHTRFFRPSLETNASTRIPILFLGHNSSVVVYKKDQS